MKSASLRLKILVAFFIPVLMGLFLNHSHLLSNNPDDEWMELEKKIQTRIDTFPGVSGIIIKDLKTGWTIQHNTQELFPSASLVKLPLMATLYRSHKQHKISLDDDVPLLSKFKAQGSGSLRHAKNGSRLTIRQLIYMMITESDNTATNMLVDLFDLNYYDSSFLAMGLSHTNISRMIMDLNKRDRGIENYTTPKDMALLLEQIYHHKIDGSREMLEILKNQKITDRLAKGLPDDWHIGHKTGMLRNSCHDVGIVFSPTNNYLICVLTHKIKDLNQAKTFISDVAKLTADYYSEPNKGLGEKKTLVKKRTLPILERLNENILITTNKI